MMDEQRAIQQVGVYRYYYDKKRLGQKQVNGRKNFNDATRRTTIEIINI